MWPFNEEIVARAIDESVLPVISAVGHETDFTIADFVADLRAPTPSAAAELAVPDIEEVKSKLINMNNRYKLALKKKVELMKLRYEKCMQNRVFKEPLQRINEQYIQIDMLVKSMESAITNQLNKKKTKAVELISKLDTLSPLKTLTRGYCIAQVDNMVIKTAKQLKEKDEIKLKFIDGERSAVVK